MSTETEARVAALVDAGSYAEAARLLEEQGEFARAQILRERIWDFAGAAADARARGDRPDALRLLFEAKDPAAATVLVAALLADGGREELSRAADVCERKRLWREAADFRLRLDEPALARELYARAGLLLEAGRIDERLGRLREAGMAYEQLLRDAPTTAGAPEARLALGRVLGTLGRHEEAVRHLQRALRASPPVSPDELRAGRQQLVASLAALGMPDGASHVLRSLGDARSDDPQALARFLAERDRALGGDLLAGRYRVARLLGSGGMGRVYLARDRVTDEDVAVKVLAPPVDPRGREGWRRFLREAQALALLRHPNLVRLREVGADEGLLVMDYMAGGTLEAGPAPGEGSSGGPRNGVGSPVAAGESRMPLAPRVAKALLAQVVRGLSAAHARGVIHRDIKPANVFLTLTGEACLGDFGVAHLQGLGATQTAGFIGTLAYMAPEQITGAPLTFACDVYGLGVTAFQMWTGRLPFTGPDFVSAHLGETPPAPSSVAPGLGPDVDRLSNRMLQKDPARRHGSLDELLQEIEAIEVDDDPRWTAAATPVGPTSAAAAAREPASAGAANRSAHATAPARYRIEAPLAATPLSSLYRAVDDRLGRAVVVERFTAEALAEEAGAARWAWLQAMARHGGPHLQRTLRLDHAERTAIYEAVEGTSAVALAVAAGSPCRAAAGPALDDPAVIAARVVLHALRALAAAHHEGVAHGGLPAALVADTASSTVVVTVAGQLAARDPASTPDRDLADLAAFVRAHGAEGVFEPVESVGPDALAGWARAVLDADRSARSPRREV